MFKTDINLNLYKTFYEVAKYKSISEAAKHSYTSQPAISKAIKRLEEELETKLFIRNKNGIELTDKGKELLYFVEKAFNNLVVAQRNMLENNNLTKGKLSIGMPSNIGSFYLFDKVISFHNTYPNIEITIITGSTDHLLNLLDSHQVDFVIDTPPFNNLNKEYKLKTLATVNYCFITSNKQNAISSLKSLEKQPLILPIPGTQNRNALEKVLEDNNVSATNVLNIHTTEMIIAAVKENLGIGYVIENLVKKDLDNNLLFKLQIKEELPSIDIILVYNPKYLTTAPNIFIKEFMDTDI